ncbi:YvcK family protein [Streptosporangiaceae bacterium NEAU-GS5]|nr:YvcK family protein [Streptosporangiaceae bacterium NEAU-GS5]
MTAVVLFAGGRGSASIARRLLRIRGIRLSLVINGYDNGHSTGALRRYLPGMLGPSDFRKNLPLHLDRSDPAEDAQVRVLEHRLPPGTTRAGLRDLVDALAVGRHLGFAALPRQVRAAVARDLTAFADRLDRRPDGFDLADCALGNLVLAGAYLRLDGDFNAAIRACAASFGSPAQLVNVTNGENAFLVAVKRDGRLLADEADIVAPQDAAPITRLFLLPGPLSPARRAELAALPPDRVRETLAGGAAWVSLNPHAREAILGADIIVYGPGTPHSSLLPTYLTPALDDAIAASRARAKVFVVNIGADHDVQGLTAFDLVDLTLSYLGDPLNERRAVTHVLCHRPVATPRSVTREGVRWVVADLEDPGRPGTHDGRRTVRALNAIACEHTLTRAG